MSWQAAGRDPSGSDRDGVPSSMPRSVVVLLGILGVVGLGIGTKAAAAIIAPTMLALVLTIAVLPIHRGARKHGWPGWLATLTALAASYLILLVMVVGTVVCLVKFADLLPSYASEAKDVTKQLENGLDKLGVSTSATSDALSKLDPTKLADALGGLISGILDALGFLFFLVTLIFFFVVAVSGFAPRVAALQRTKPDLAAAMRKFLRGTQTYLLMTALFGAIVGVLDAGALWLLGVPLPLVWGFFSFLTNFIPNIGFIIGIIPPALPGTARRRVAGAAAGDRGLQRPQRHDPDVHPAAHRRQLGRAQRRDHLHVAGRLDVPARCARSAPGRADDAARPRDIHRLRPSGLVGGPADRRQGRGPATTRGDRSGLIVRNRLVHGMQVGFDFVWWRRA